MGIVADCLVYNKSVSFEMLFSPAAARLVLRRNLRVCALWCARLRSLVRCGVLSGARTGALWCALMPSAAHWCRWYSSGCCDQQLASATAWWCETSATACTQSDTLCVSRVPDGFWFCPCRTTFHFVRLTRIGYPESLPTQTGSPDSRRIVVVDRCSCIFSMASDHTMVYCSYQVQMWSTWV